MTGWKFSRLVKCFLMGLILTGFLNAGACFGIGGGEGISSPVCPFGPGEKFIFRVIYFAAPAGTFTLEVGEMTELQGVPVYHFIAKAQSSTIFSLFYKVRDKIESFVNAETFVPLRFEKHLREGPRYRNDEITVFDRLRNVVLTDDKEIPIEPDVQDVLSTFYYLRMQPLEVGKSVFVNVNADEKNYCVEVKVLRKETMKKWGRRVETVVIQPVVKMVKLGGILKEKGDVFIWLTNDEKRIPIFMKAKVTVGQLSFVLVDYEMGEISDEV